MLLGFLLDVASFLWVAYVGGNLIEHYHQLGHPTLEEI